jgi:hypothetical protein
MEMTYCTRCGRAVPLGGIDEGKYFLVGGEPVCPACYRQVPEEEHTGDTVVKAPKTEGRGSSARLTPAVARRPVEAPAAREKRCQTPFVRSTLKGRPGKRGLTPFLPTAAAPGSPAKYYLAAALATAILAGLIWMAIPHRPDIPGGDLARIANTPVAAPAGRPAEPGKTAPTAKPEEPKKTEPPPKPEEPKKVEPAPPPAAGELKPGLAAEFYKFAEGEEAGFLPADAKKKPDLARVDAQVNFEVAGGEFANSGLEDRFHVLWRGVIRTAAAGKHRFFLNSDDGSRLVIDGKLVVDNGGLHGMEEKEGAAELAAGDHDILVEFFENDGDAGCILSWEPPGGTRQVVPASALFHREAVAP